MKQSKDWDAGFEAGFECAMEMFIAAFEAVRKEAEQ